MWKILVAFILAAVAVLFLLSKGGDIDMSGEKHSIEAGEHGAGSTAASTAAPVASVAASAASEAASAAASAASK